MLYEVYLIQLEKKNHNINTHEVRNMLINWNHSFDIQFF